MIERFPADTTILRLSLTHCAFDHFYRPADGFINSPDQAEEAVHWQVKNGVDLIKILAVVERFLPSTIPRK